MMGHIQQVLYSSPMMTQRGRRQYAPLGLICTLNTILIKMKLPPTTQQYLYLYTKNIYSMYNE